MGQSGAPILNSILPPGIQTVGLRYPGTLPTANNDQPTFGSQKNNGPNLSGPLVISFGSEVVRASVWPFLPILRLVLAADSG